MSMDCVVARSAEVISSQIAGETIAMHLDKGTYFGFDRIGTAIWDELTEPIAVRSICDRLVERFDVDRERCEREVSDYLCRLEREGIIEVHEDAGHQAR